MKEMFDEKLPKYYLVKKAIVENIDNEVYDSKEPIPSERELMETYQVSRITIRKAIDELVTEGYLYKVQGKGTYVKTDEGSNNLFSITSCTEDVLKLGLTPSKKVVVSELVDANVKRAKALEITTSDNVYMIGRILYADKEPLNYTLTFLPEKIFPGLSKYDLKKESLYQIITEVYGVKITKARRTIEAIGAQDEIAEYLDIEEGTPIILFRCITYGIVNGREIPIENFKCYYRTDKFKFYIDQVRYKIREIVKLSTSSSSKSRQQKCWRLFNFWKNVTNLIQKTKKKVANRCEYRWKNVTILIMEVQKHAGKKDIQKIR